MQRKNLLAGLAVVVLLIGMLANSSVTQRTAAARPLTATATSSVSQITQGELVAKLRQQRAEHPDWFKLTPTQKEEARNFEVANPKIVKALRKGKISFSDFGVVVSGMRDNSNMREMAYRFQGGTVKLPELVRASRELRGISTMGKESDPMCQLCGLLTELYASGCFDGGGDPFFCWVAAMGYECRCRSVACYEPGDSMIPECGPIF